MANFGGALGNYFIDARYYNPSIGRFISEDSYRGRIEFTLSLNLYTYCHNEPIMYWDPSGHFAESDKQYSDYIQGKIHEASEDYYYWHEEIIAAKEAGDTEHEAEARAARTAAQAEAEKWRSRGDDELDAQAITAANIKDNVVSDDTDDKGSNEGEFIDRVKQAGSGVVDIVTGTGQVVLGSTLAGLVTVSSCGILTPAAAIGTGGIMVIGGSNITGGLAKIVDSVTVKDIDESVFDFVEKSASKSKAYEIFYHSVDIITGVVATIQGGVKLARSIESGATIADLTADFSTTSDLIGTPIGIGQIVYGMSQTSGITDRHGDVLLE